MRQKGSLWFHPVSLCGYSAHNYSVIAKCGCFPGTTSMCSSATFYNKCSLCNHDCNQNTHCAIPSNVSLCCAFIVTPFHPAPPSSTPANTNLLSIYIILSFWECCVNQITYYLIGFFSLSIIHLRIKLLPGSIRHFFLLLSSILQYKCTKVY